MGRLLRLGALACMYMGVESKALRWQDDTPSWSPPKETIAVMDMGLGFSPAPTAAPNPADVELKLAKRVRGEDTCGYISGISTNSIYCEVGSCVYNSFYAVLGCCDSSSVSDCRIATGCLPLSSSRFYTSSDSLMRFCSSSALPECVKYVYSGTPFSRYTLFACASSEASIVVYANPLDNTSERGFTTASIDDVSTTEVAPVTSIVVPSPGPVTTTPTPGGGGGGSSTPVGAIVGGVVGGLAAIAIIVGGVILLLRRKKKDGADNNNNPNSQAPPVMFNPQPQPGQQPQIYQAPPGQQPPPGGYAPNTPGAFPPGFAPTDNRQSMFKQSYEVTTGPYDQSSVSPPASPPPVSPSPTYQSGIPGYSPSQGTGPSPTQAGYPAPQQQQQGGYYNAPPAQQQQQQTTTTTQQTYHNHHQSFASELPATRGDGELREMA